jgi:hypothetical protein
MRLKQKVLKAGAIMIIFFMIAGLNACNNETEIPENPIENIPRVFATDWIEMQLHLIKNTNGFSAPVTARSIGYTGLIFYESIVHGTSEYKSLKGQLNGFDNLPLPEEMKSYHWGLTANAALYEISRELFRNAPNPSLGALEALYTSYYDQFSGETEEEISTISDDFGKALAKSISDWAKTDGGYGAFNDNFPSEFVPEEGEGLWEPVASEKALHPYWGDNRPFMLANKNIDPGPPTPYSTSTDSKFHEEAMEVFDAVNNRTDDQEQIAFFWTDDPNATYTPAGHFLSIYLQTIKAENSKTEFIAYGWAKLGLAVNDAFISCWQSKFQYNYIRPITYIQNHVDAGWIPMIITPPFPEYTSGHSVQAGAAVEVLTDLFGDNYAFTDHTHDNLDLGLSPRSYTSFYDCADEAAMSRLYGGIHFMPAITIGVDQGKKIGENVNNLNYNP